MKQKIVDKKSRITIFAVQKEIDLVQNFANEKHEGNFSRALRDIIEAGIQALKLK